MIFAQQKEKSPLLQDDFSGADRGIRTPDPQFRRLMLYPAELCPRNPSKIGQLLALREKIASR